MPNILVDHPYLIPYSLDSLAPRLSLVKIKRYMRISISILTVVFVKYDMFFIAALLGMVQILCKDCHPWTYSISYSYHFYYFLVDESNSRVLLPVDCLLRSAHGDNNLGGSSPVYYIIWSACGDTKCSISSIWSSNLSNKLFSYQCNDI